MRKQKKLTLETMTIVREGEFVINVVGNTHCGARAAGMPVGDLLLIPVRYKCTVECKPVTDYRGFLFDQVHVDDWLKKYAEEYEITESCEELSRTLSDMLVEKISNESPGCRILRFSLTLSPSPFVASVSATYTR